MRYCKSWLIAGLIFILTACSVNKEESKEKSWTGIVMTKQDIVVKLNTFFYAGSGKYAVVNSKWLAIKQKVLQSDMFLKGLPAKWQISFDCNFFAKKFVADSGLDFTIQKWNSKIDAEALAVGEIWVYTNETKTQGHALVIAVTERGIVFWEPQPTTNHEISLTDWQIKNAIKIEF